MRVANARMYSVDATVAQAWRSLLQWVVDRARVDVEVIDYPPPQPLPALWKRDDIACVFMCGYPLSRRSPPPAVLAAPIPSPPAYGGRAIYWTNLIVREDGAVRTLDDTLGKRMAFTTSDSQSGYQAPRSLFAPYAKARGLPLFAQTIGPLVTPRRVVEAVLAGEADAGPVDSYAFDLMRHHERDWMSPLRVVATTPPMPIPPLVGAADIAQSDAARLRDTLLSVAGCDELAPLRDALLLRGFAPATAASYAILREAADAATAAGYRTLE